MLYDVIVIGGSAAGLAAALYAGRQGLKTLVITKDLGGQMLLTGDIQNYPGFQDIAGFELANKFKEQVELYAVQFVYEEVIKIESDECPGLCFKVNTGGMEYYAIAVILAFGKTPRNLNVPGEGELKGRGVSYCAICDGPLFGRKKVAVVGSGEQALDAVNYLANIAETVYLIHNHDRPIGPEDLVDRISKLPNVKLMPNSKVTALGGASKVEKVIVADIRTGEKNEIGIDGIFVEIGYETKTAWLKDLVRLTSLGQIEVDKECKTSHPGVFAAGDVTDTPYMQVIISAGQGATAALSAYRYVQGLRGRAAARVDWRDLKPSATT
jgi:thioredoxin reductase (NADPH)